MLSCKCSLQFWVNLIYSLFLVFHLSSSHVIVLIRSIGSLRLQAICSGKMVSLFRSLVVICIIFECIQRYTLILLTSLSLVGWIFNTVHSAHHNCISVNGNTIASSLLNRLWFFYLGILYTYSPTANIFWSDPCNLPHKDNTDWWTKFAPLFFETP